MDDQNKNLILATALSFLVILVWFVLFPPEPSAVDPNAPIADGSPVATTSVSPPAATGTDTKTAATPGTDTGTTPALAETARITIQTPKLSGSIALLGGRIDDLLLNDYRETLDDGSPNVTLLSPVGQTEAYYALFGWAPGGDLKFSDVPGPDTPWAIVSGDILTPQTPVTLGWNNGAGLTFERTIQVDNDYMFSVTESVNNTSDHVARLAPSIELVRHGTPSDLKNFFILHEGAIRQSGEEMKEFDYDDVSDFDRDARWGANSKVIDVQSNGWIGFTDHFWMTTIIPDANQPFESVLQYDARSDKFRSIARLETLTVEPGTTQSTTTRLFAGAKDWETIRNYQKENGVYKFLDSIDWGWFFFLTKPIFAVLHWLNGIIGNMGWSIIALTLIIKAILFPLAYKSYVSMAKMKELQPEMEKLKEAAGDDRQKVQKGMMELYKKHKVNPASGCLPIVMQIPIFFSLYKVIFVTLDLRQAPWFGWIKDLSQPDPSSILNLFGLLSFAPPDPSSLLAIVSLGILPIILGITMWLQQKLNPAPTDPTQQMIFAWMPWVFMFMLGGFASGLVVYWIANNTITFTQQYLIMRSQGVKPDVFGNILSGFKRKDAKKE
ncbi:MAG: membrane protein insertase YidC [Marinosulfonomonas sp.]|nr:membrane protein insertase YidC [Marinosulfonomonas sp.]